MTATSTIRACLEQEFNIAGGRLRRISHAAFNQHFVLTGADESRLHVVVRPRHGRADDRSAIESRLRMASRLRGASALLCRTWRRTRSGTFTAETANGRVVSVRAHRGQTCSRYRSAERMAATVRLHAKALQRAIPVVHVPHLRYLSTKPSLPRITRRIDSFIRTTSRPAVVRELLAQVASLAKPLSIRSDAFVHGDLHFSNLIDVGEGQLCVIDHECTHRDVADYDAAHLWLSVSFAGDLDGEFDEARALNVEDRFSRMLAVPRERLRETARYVLLKKIALVEQPKHLYLESRIRVLRWLAEEPC